MIKVLVVDDSAVVRMLLQQGLNLDPDIKVVGAAPDPYRARDMILDLQPDVLTLDVEMPRMDGVEFLRILMTHHPLPVIMVSALTEKGKKVTMDCLEAGAFDCIAKPSGSFGGKGLNEMLLDLRGKIKEASRANLQVIRKTLSGLGVPKTKVPRSQVLAETTDKVIAIGSSTGGTNVIRELIHQLPPETPGIVIVQHIISGFSGMFAQRLNEVGALEVREAADGDRIITGRVLVAPANLQMKVVRSGGHYLVKCVPEGPVSGHRPSADVLFDSVADAVGPNAIGVILTGMGSDGAKGLLKMRKAGARTMGQDEASCVVFGMPKAAWELGAVEHLLPTERLVPGILEAVRKGPHPVPA